MCIQNFDAVVVASGHYHAPRVPTTPGLADWKKRWPDRVEHSKRYRKPENSENKVLLSLLKAHLFVQVEPDNATELSTCRWKRVSNGYCARTQPIRK